MKIASPVLHSPPHTSLVKTHPCPMSYMSSSVYLRLSHLHTSPDVRCTVNGYSLPKSLRALAHVCTCAPGLARHVHIVLAMNTHALTRLTYTATLSHHATMWAPAVPHAELYDMCDNLGGVGYPDFVQALADTYEAVRATHQCRPAYLG